VAPALTAPAWDRDALTRSPWFASVRRFLERLPADRFPAADDLSALAREGSVRSGGGAHVVFVPPAALGLAARHYEERIFRAGEVATRPGSWHDLFNALAWLAFPRTKAVLNRLHHDELARRGDGPARGTARDVATLFDEGGMVVACAVPELGRLLHEFRWKRLFWERRAEVARSMRFLVFGHAILEHSLAPFKGVTAKALVLDVPNESLDDPALVGSLDARAVGHFARAESLASTQSLQPLPVLGIPGWTPENEDPAFYDDTAVFRPGRARRTGKGARSGAP
jgi:Protein of unknown function (DUF3025)